VIAPAVLAVTILLAAAAAAAEPPRPVSHELEETARARVTVSPDVTDRQLRNVNHVAYTVPDASGIRRERLATIVSMVHSRTDGEGFPGSTVTAYVRDLSQPKPRLLATIKAPGSLAAVVADRYLATTVLGCCGGADRHQLHALETGRPLFRASGPAPTGISAFFEPTNNRPRRVRWAALEGGLSKQPYKVLARLTYGSDEGPISTLLLSGTREKDEEWLEDRLAGMAELAWTGAGIKPGDEGTAARPADAWDLDERTPTKPIGGMTLTLRLGDTELLAIPVTADRLDLAAARIDPSLALRSER
jgi:hypothetical protein